MSDTTEYTGTERADGKKDQRLPKRKWNSPVARIVCWKCKLWGYSKEFRKALGLPPIVLYRLRYPNGKKSPDYACQEHLSLGLPPIGNQSEIKFQYAA